MATILALLMVLDQKAARKKRLRPSHMVGEVLRAWSPSPVVVDLHRRRTNPWAAQVEEAARQALRFVSRVENMR